MHRRIHNFLDIPDIGCYIPRKERIHSWIPAHGEIEVASFIITLSDALGADEDNGKGTMPKESYFPRSIILGHTCEQPYDCHRKMESYPGISLLS